ncbi:hypothetical protein [Escherichia coli]|uniref:hypothetical protein n=1 Tax=Escherichia coli TaxID=562 RepID=UPI0037DD7F0A
MKYDIENLILQMVANSEKVSGRTLRDKLPPEYEITRQALDKHIKKFKLKYQLSQLQPSTKDIIYGILHEKKGKVTTQELITLTGFSECTIKNYRSDWRKTYRNEYFL